MNSLTSNNNSMVPQRQKSKFSVAIQTKGYQELINSTLRDPNRAQRFIASITSAVAVNPNLQDCTASTILAGALVGESLNLSPSPQLGQYYLMPFECRLKGPDGRAIPKKDENGNFVYKYGRQVYETEKKASFVIGYRGLVQLALRSGQYRRINVLEVKAGELKKWNPFTEEIELELIEDDMQREATATVGYVATFEYMTGFTKTLYWSKEKMLHHADTYSAAFSAEAYKDIQLGKIPEKDMWKYSSFWYKSFDDMAKKTMLRQLISKWGIMSTELATAFESDDKLADINGGEIKIVGDPDDVEPPVLNADDFGGYEDVPPEENIPVAAEEPKPATRTRKTTGKQINMDELG